MTKEKYMALADFQTLWTDSIKPYLEETLATKAETNTKEGKIEIVPVASGATSLNAEVGKYYSIAGTVGTLTVNLPAISNATTLSILLLSFTTGAAPNVTFVASGGKTIAYFEGYSIAADKSYELNIIYNGTKWIVAHAVIA